MIDLPASAAWRHLDARDGFEVVFARRKDGGYRFEGYSTAVEDGEVWSVRYEITLDGDWRTLDAHVSGASVHGPAAIRLERAPEGWRVDGRPLPELADCADVDLEASALTNAFPVHRLRLEVGASADAPAAYVRAPTLEVERLSQRYARLGDARYDYESPSFGFRAELEYDAFGLVLDYPGIAVRVA